MKFPDRTLRGPALAGLLLVLSGCGESPHDRDTGQGIGSRTAEADFHTLRTPPLGAGEFEIITLSALPDAVTGGDVLVALRGLNPDDTFAVLRDGADVTAAFAREVGGEVVGLVAGLVTGLALGENRLSARVSGVAGTRSAEMRVMNHPISGPVISGPHQEPFVCRTEEAGLGAPQDEDCFAPTRVQWFYRSLLTQTFTELADPFVRYPPDVLNTRLRDGRVVPYVVRVESAVINRGITRIGVLDDPAARGRDAAFDAANWNGRVYYVFGESCGVGYQQGINQPGFVLGSLLQNLGGLATDAVLINLVGSDQRLGEGDGVVHSTLSTFGVHCNPLVSVETTMMIKEHITERYGRIESVLGANGSGAALQQYNALNNAPGLLSGALPTASFADIVSTAMTVADCGLLEHYYERSPLNWTGLKRAMVNGHNLLSGNSLTGICQSWNSQFLQALDPGEGCDDAVPRALRYDPVTHPRGARCTLQDANVNLFGRDPATGFARRPLDNTGIQYGLDALNRRVISVEEFLDLNRHVGGFDIDGNFSGQRMRMDPELEALVYRVGGVIGRGALAESPTMDLAIYLDLLPALNIHESVRPFTIRERLRRFTGQDQTQAIWRGVLTQPDAFDVMDEWLQATALARPAFGGDHVSAVRAVKPARAADRCVIATLGGRLALPDTLLLPLGLQAPLLPLIPGVAELLPGIDLDIPLRLTLPENFDSGLGLCTLLLPVTRTPRMVAGMPLSDDVIRCQLKPIDSADYAVPLSAAEYAQLESIFPDGVCDYRLPAAGDVARSLIWPSIGGESLEAPHGLVHRVARSR